MHFYRPHPRLIHAGARAQYHNGSEGGLDDAGDDEIAPEVEDEAMGLRDQVVNRMWEDYIDVRHARGLGLGDEEKMQRR